MEIERLGWFHIAFALNLFYHISHFKKVNDQSFWDHHLQSQAWPVLRYDVSALRLSLLGSSDHSWDRCDADVNPTSLLWSLSLCGDPCVSVVIHESLLWFFSCSYDDPCVSFVWSLCSHRVFAVAVVIQVPLLWPPCQSCDPEPLLWSMCHSRDPYVYAVIGVLLLWSIICAAPGISTLPPWSLCQFCSPCGTHVILITLL